MSRTEGRADPALSEVRIASAPEPIKALFRDFEFWAVIAALEAVGMNGPPTAFAPSWLVEAARQARARLEDDLMDASPGPVKALYREFESPQVIAALRALGANPAKVSPQHAEAIAVDVRKLLEAEGRRRQEEMLRGS